MKKTLTMAAVAATFAGMAVAAIETSNVGGYLDKSGDLALVCNPFVASGKLADIDGSALGASASIRIVAATGAVTDYKWTDGKWKNGDVDGSDVTLMRGYAFQISGSGTVSVSGVIAEDNVSNLPVVKGYNLYGNVVPAAKTLGSLSFSAFDANRDYVRVGSTKYVLKKGHWYRKSDLESATSLTGLTTYDSLSLAAAEGFVVYCGKTPKTLTISGTLPAGN